MRAIWIGRIVRGIVIAAIAANISAATVEIRLGEPHRLDTSSSLLIAETRGMAVNVSVTFTAEKDGSTAIKTYDLRPFEQRVLDVGGAVRSRGPLQVSFTTDGAGVVVVATEEETDASISRQLLLSPFKAAPFRDPGTGLVLMRDRWYDPATATFLSPDPEDQTDSSNAYAFCAGDPVNCSDPTGRLGDGGDLREHFRQKERVEAAWRHAIWCAQNPVSCRQLEVRGHGITRMVGGLGQTAAGTGAVLSTGPIPEPVAKGFGGTAIVRGIDNAITGAVETWTGIPRDTTTRRLLYLALVKSGVDSLTASRITGWTEVGVDVASTIGSSIITSLRAPALPATVARSFTNSQYTMRVLTEETIVFRVEGSRFGRWFGTVRPSSAAEAERLYNVVDYGNDLTRVASYRIPKGAIVYEGRVAGGAGIQMYVPDPLAAGVQFLETTTLPQFGY